MGAGLEVVINKGNRGLLTNWHGLLVGKKWQRRWKRLVASKGPDQVEGENISPGRRRVVP